MTERKTREQIRAELDEEDRKLDELLLSLEIPEYTDRHLKADWVKNKTQNSITGTSGWGSWAPDEVVAALEIGDPYILETKGFNTISGWIIKGKYYARKSDQDLNREHQKLLQDIEDRQRKTVEANRNDWIVREAALPDWLKAQMKIERETSKNFEEATMGWGYTLITCELAALYAEMGGEILDKSSMSIDLMTKDISDFARQNGTSGNQHDFALMLAKRHIQGTKND